MLTENNQAPSYSLVTRLLITGGVIGPLLFNLALLVEGPLVPATMPGARPEVR